MEKVKVTRAQAEAIDYFRKTFVENKATSMSNEKLAAALNRGYEVEPEFKVGDWIHNKKANRVAQIDNRYSGGETLWIDDEQFNFYHVDDVRHATPEEIRQEKERRWWAKIGRKINEYKKGDVVSTGSITRPINYLFENGELGLEGMDYGYKPDELILVCLVENRLDLNE